MNDLSEEQQWLLQRALDNLGSGIPAAQTLARSDCSARDQRVVRERIEQMSAGVRR